MLRSIAAEDGEVNVATNVKHLEIRGTKGQTACPYCCGNAFYLLSSIDYNRQTTKMSFDYYRCSQCDLIFMDNPPADMSPYYKGGYDEIPLSYDALRIIAANERYRTESVFRYKMKGRLLEIGPWRGAICANMKEAGFTVTAIEMDEACVAFLRDHVGIQAIQSSDPAKAMKHLTPGFDVIVAWHSLEHLPNPWIVIEQAAQLLAPEGVLLLAMPNPESYEFAVMKNRWMHLDAPRHLYFYSMKSLVSICKKHGLEPLQLTTSDKFSCIQSRHAWRSWARSWVSLRYVRGAVGLIAYWSAYKKQTTEGLGSAYTALFVRRSDDCKRL